MASQLRTEIKSLLEEKDYDGVVALSRKKRNLFRHLVAMTYDKADVVSWRAMEAVGEVVAHMPKEEGREAIQKVLWMLREESGNNAWSAPEILGEILRANPAPYKDIVPVLVSFHDEEFFRPGVLWAMYRIAQRWPELIEPFSDIASEHAKSPEPSARAYAALVLNAIGKPIPKKTAGNESGTVLIYEDGSLAQVPVDELIRIRA